jgi:hypothetical protein
LEQRIASPVCRSPLKTWDRGSGIHGKEKSA